MYSRYGDNNLVLFHLWWIETALKREKAYKYSVQNFPLIAYLPICNAAKTGWECNKDKFYEHLSPLSQTLEKIGWLYFVVTSVDMLGRMQMVIMEFMVVLGMVSEI